MRPPTSAVASVAPAAPPAGGSSVMSLTRTADAQHALAPSVVETRWRKTATTFGPLGRILATIGLVLPFIFFVVLGILTGGLTIAGAVIWGFVIMPWGLRDTWKAGQVPIR